MSDRLAELLKLASNDSGDTSDDKPPGVRVGDILSNGWASNRNPLKLFMYLGMSHDSFRGINIDGKSAGPVRKGNAVKIVLPRDTPDYWRTWELLAKQLPLLCLAVLCLSGCLTPAKLQTWSTEADTIAQASKDPKCVQSALDLQTAIVRALETQKNATRYLDGAAAPDVARARAAMMTVCKRKEMER